MTLTPYTVCQYINRSKRESKCQAGQEKLELKFLQQLMGWTKKKFVMMLFRVKVLLFKIFSNLL